jgi:hypothetical protein
MPGNEPYTVELRAPFAPNCLNYLSPVSQLLTGRLAKKAKTLCTRKHFYNWIADCVERQQGAAHARAIARRQDVPCLSEKNAGANAGRFAYCIICRYMTSASASRPTSMVRTTFIWVTPKRDPALSRLRFGNTCCS